MLPHFRILISKEPSFLAVSEALQQHLGMLQSLFYINNETFKNVEPYRGLFLFYRAVLRGLEYWVRKFVLAETRLLLPNVTIGYPEHHNLRVECYSSYI